MGRNQGNGQRTQSLILHLHRPFHNLLNSPHPHATIYQKRHDIIIIIRHIITYYYYGTKPPPPTAPALDWHSTKRKNRQPCSFRFRIHCTPHVMACQITDDKGREGAASCDILHFTARPPAAGHRVLLPAPFFLPSRRACRCLPAKRRTSALATNERCRPRAQRSPRPLRTGGVSAIIIRRPPVDTHGMYIDEQSVIPQGGTKRAANRLCRPPISGKHPSLA